MSNVCQMCKHLSDIWNLCVRYVAPYLCASLRLICCALSLRVSCWGAGMLRAVQNRFGSIHFDSFGKRFVMKVVRFDSCCCLTFGTVVQINRLLQGSQGGLTIISTTYISAFHLKQITLITCAAELSLMLLWLFDNKVVGIFVRPPYELWVLCRHVHMCIYIYTYVDISYDYIYIYIYV